MPHDLINYKPVSAVIKEFFGSSAALAVHGPDQPALRDHAQAAPLGARAGRSHARARRLRGARRAPDALRPHLPDRDAGRSEHRPDRVALDLRARQRVRLHRDAVPRGRGRRASPTRSSISRRSRRRSTSIAQANAPIDAKRQLHGATSCPSRNGGEFVMVPPERGRRSWTCRRTSSCRWPRRSSRSSRTTTPTARSWARTCSARRCRCSAPRRRWSAPAWSGVVARDSGVTVVARARRRGRAGRRRRASSCRPTSVERRRAIPSVDIYNLIKYQRSNQNTCINQKPIVQRGRPRAAPATSSPTVRRPSIGRAGARPQRARRLHAVGRVQLRGLDPDLRARRQATTSSPRSTSRSSSASRATPSSGPEEITRDIPNVGEEALKDLDESRHHPHRRRGEAGRHPGRQDHAEGRDAALARREAAARDLRREGRRGARHVAARAARRRGHGHQRPRLLAQGRPKDERAARDRGGRGRPSSSKDQQDEIRIIRERARAEGPQAARRQDATARGSATTRARCSLSKGVEITRRDARRDPVAATGATSRSATTKVEDELDRVWSRRCRSRSTLIKHGVRREDRAARRAATSCRRASSRW